MPSSGERTVGCASEPGRIPKKELWLFSMTDSIRGDIRFLSLRRHAAYEQARAHRRDGQLVPASLCQELAENGVRLRQALDRYTQATGGPAGGLDLAKGDFSVKRR